MKDPHTLSNHNDYKVKHIETALRISFEDRKILGKVVIHVQRAIENAEKELHLDTSFLDISEVTIDRKTTSWNLHTRQEPFGSRLSISLPAYGLGTTAKVEIHMSTTDECTALGWMTAAQSRSSHPFVYSQCQAIHARSLFPCQDTPSIKSTHKFAISSPFPVLASGLSIGIEEDPAMPDNKIYSFRQDIPIPSYLFAIASGDLVSASIGPRSLVATTPSMLGAAKWEFEESIEKYIQIIEDIVFPYPWREYNLLVLPSSFPYGGMENPVYTYVTPTTISGDRENIDVIAHELSHSYSGNYVTGASWSDFWLNEGWTTYLERRIQARLFGEEHRGLSGLVGWKSLTDTVERLGASHEFTKLVPDMTGVDPDDAYSTVAYEKGYAFLTYLEGVITEDKWNLFIPHFFSRFAKQSVDSYQFKDSLITFFAYDHGVTEALNALDWHTWYDKPGLPWKPDFDTALALPCYSLAAKWQQADEAGFSPSPSDIQGWRAAQKNVFLDKIQEFEQPLSKDLAHEMGIKYGLYDSKNVEISSRYYIISMTSRNSRVYELATKLLGTVGRMKFVRPLYRKLNEVDHSLALRTFELNKDYYHPICKRLVAKDLGVQL